MDPYKLFSHVISKIFRIEIGKHLFLNTGINPITGMAVYTRIEWFVTR